MKVKMRVSPVMLILIDLDPFLFKLAMRSRCLFLTPFTTENVHLLGSNDNNTQATKVISDLIMGRPTAKANPSLRAIQAAIVTRLRREY
jgi:hypothetical protein